MIGFGLALALATGCGEAPPTGGLGTPCTSTADCVASPPSRCINNRCREDVPAIEVGFEVTPPVRLARELDLARQQFPLRSARVRQQHILNLDTAANVLLAADSQVDVTIRRTAAPLPGRRLVSSLRVFPVGAGRNEYSRVRLLPSSAENQLERYEIVAKDVLALPTLERPPSVRTVRIDVETTTIAVPTTDFVAVRGQVVRSTQQSVPVPDVLVLAEGVSSRRTSSRARTGAARGRFTIELPDADFGDAAFILRAVPPADQQPAWSYREVIPAPDRDIDDLIVPLEPPVEEERRCIQLAIVDGLQRVPRASVELEAIDTRAPTIAHRLAGRGRRDGVVERQAFGRGASSVTSTTSLPVMAGTYAVEIRPPEVGRPGDPPLDLSRYPTLDDGRVPAGLPFGFTTTTLEIPRADGLVEPGRDPCATDAIAELQLTVQPRKLVIGRVVAEPRPLQNEPFVRFMPVGREDVGGFSARADTTGDFAVFLEPGCYVWTVEPAGADRLDLPIGFGVLEVAPIDSPETGLVQRLARPLAIPNGVTIDGRVILPDGQSGAPFAEVEAFSRIPGVPGVVAVERAFTDPEGRFIMRLPTRASTSPAPCGL
jgi:hypothetical protein